MTTFKFLHAADLHLDSPLIGLAAKSADYAARVDNASRQAFDKLVNLAIDEGCRFIVLAGDVFDGDLRNFATGLYFMAGMQKLRQANVGVFLILGNHDAENRFAGKLQLSDNVHVFSRAQPTSQSIPDLAVSVHGRSYPRRDVTENLALSYPPPINGHFNIGVLHTACEGRDGQHAAYAPCTVEQLVNHGYDYWALGHIHARAVLHTYPHVVYSGNLQGRSVRETGGKGATLITVTDARVAALEHYDLDVVRWAHVVVDAACKADRAAVIDHMRHHVGLVCQQAAERAVALRLTLCGKTPLHAELMLQQTSWREDVETLLATFSNDCWLEKLIIKTMPQAVVTGLDPTLAGSLTAHITDPGAEAECRRLIEARIAEVKVKFPAAARAEALFAQLRAEMPARITALALSTIGGGEADVDAPH